MANSAATALEKKHYSPMQYINILVTALLMFGFGFLPPFATLTPVGMRLLGIFLGVIYGYSTCEIVWPSLRAMVAIREGHTISQVE